MLARYIARTLFLVLLLISLFVKHFFGFMTLNLILAYIPYELSLLLRVFKPHKKYEWTLFVIYSIVFFLLVPNTFYMVTDLIHLNQFAFNFLGGVNLMEWAHFSYLFAAIMLALYCYILIFMELRRFTSSKAMNRIFFILLVVLNALGIYVGRFLRFHTVYLIEQPLYIPIKVFKSLDLESVLFILLLIGLQSLLILMVKGVREIRC
ncbi:DUF1361 domain-containing protein [Staphylococcus massiliensis]|uniref:DUF1361 domain-containing protein n=1 Tax=Staphylococcus massiliensis TaxID=555791 RepID=UPI001EDEE824|nr:DUF1361 domain-containing protein [Staphylococcus massiliensis]MCG3401858.1 DUF1361 domain-containing protein [Staphylococcus massiliensis]